MSKFDYTIHKVVGVVRKENTLQSNARVFVVGYIDGWHYIPFQENELQDIFRNEGFVHYAISKHKVRYSYENQLIFFSVIESEDYESTSKERFSVEFNGLDLYKHTPVINVSKTGLLETVELNGYDNYYKVGSRIYKISKKDRKKGIGKYWQINEDFLSRNNSYICKSDKDVYIIADEISDPLFSYGEMLNTQEIINFVVDIINKHSINPKNFKTIPDGLISMLDIPAKILQFRFDEFNSALESVTLTHNQIMQIASNPIMSDALQRSIKEYEDEYIQMYESRNRDKIQKLKTESEDVVREKDTELQKLAKEHRNNILEIEKEIKQKEYERDQIIAQINKRTKEAEALEERFEVINEQKGRLIEDFSVIKDVLGGSSNNVVVNNHIIQRTVVFVENSGIPIEDQAEFIGHLKMHLKNNQLSIEDAPNIIRPFIGRNKIGHNADVMLFPSIKLIKPLIDTLGTYNLLSVTVCASWKSYDDLYMNGFSQIVESAISNPERINILLLQNMNLSYVSQYMQPINDVLCGITNLIPTSKGMIKYPSNLWIFGTRTEEEALPMSLDALKEYCCIERKEYNVEEDLIEDLPSKYITMELVDKLRAEEYSYKSAPESYLD